MRKPSHINQRVYCKSCPLTYCLSCQPAGCKCGGKSYLTDHGDIKGEGNIDIKELKELGIIDENEERIEQPVDNWNGLLENTIPFQGFDMNVTTAVPQGRYQDGRVPLDRTLTEDITHERLMRMMGMSHGAVAASSESATTPAGTYHHSFGLALPSEEVSLPTRNTVERRGRNAATYRERARRNARRLEGGINIHHSNTETSINGMRLDTIILDEVQSRTTTPYLSVEEADRPE